MKKRGIAVVFLLALSLLLGACGGPTPPADGAAPAVAPDTTAPAEEPGLTLTIAITADENTLTPITYVRGTPGIDMLRFLYDSLFTISPENEVIPWMVDDAFTISDDFRVFEMTLLDGQRWHDGTPVTAEDVRFTFTFFKEEEVHSRWTPIASRVEHIDVDGNRITFTLYHSDYGFLRSGLADIRIISRAAHEGVADASTVPNMGSGAFRLAAYAVGQYYILEAMEGYFRGTPRVQRIYMPIMTDRAVIQQALAAGEIAAFTGTIGAELLGFFEDAPGITVGQGDGFASTLLLMSNVTPPFDNRAFRNAVSMAIDVQAIVDMVFLGLAEAGTAGYVRSGLAEHVEGLPHVFDIAEANAILDSLGYTERNNAGIRLNPDGSPLVVELIVSAANTNRIRTAEIISVQLREIGIEVQIRSMDPGTVDEHVWPDFDTAAEHNYQMAIWGWSAPVVQRPGAIAQVLSSDFSGLGGLNLAHFTHAEADELSARLAASIDPSERAELNARLQRIAAEYTPFVTLGFEDAISAVNTDMYDGWVFPRGTFAMNLFSFLP